MLSRGRLRDGQEDGRNLPLISYDVSHLSVALAMAGVNKL